MKKYLFILSLLYLGTIYAQNKISSGEYWFDADLQTTEKISINSEQNLHLLMNVSVDELNDGLHTIHFRFKDDNNIWTAAVSKFFVKKTIQGTASSILVTEYEYWFDNQLTTRTRLDVDDLAAFNLKNELDVSALANGLHTVHFRFLDTKGDWSSAVSKFFIKSTINNLGIAKEITSFEYWFDNDLQTRHLKSPESTELFSLNEPLDVSSLERGLHTVHYRFKDSQNMWSSALSKFFVVKKENGITTTAEISRVDHWVDNKIEEMVSSPLENKSEISLKLNLDVSKLDDGLHTLHYRFVDNHGLYSSAISRFFVKRPMDRDLRNNKIVAYRYWLNDSVMHYANLKDSAQQLIFIDSLDLRTYNKGEYFVHMQFKDEQGLWSSAVSDTIQKLAFLYAELSATMQKSCLGDSVQFTALIADADVIEWDVGDETKDTTDSFVHTYASDGSYPVSLLIRDTSEQISKSFHLESGVVVHPAASVSLGDSLALFSNESRTLDAGNDFTEYLWNDMPGESTFEFSASEMGLGRHVIKLSVKDLNGCMAGDTIIINVRSGVGIQSATAPKIKVYPNPSTNYICIDWSEMHKGATSIRMIDMQGKVVLQRSNIEAGNEIDIHHLSSGQYLLQIQMSEQVYTVPIGKL